MRHNRANFERISYKEQISIRKNPYYMIRDSWRRHIRSSPRFSVAEVVIIWRNICWRQEDEQFRCWKQAMVMRERENFSGRQLPLVALNNFSARCTQHCSSHNMRLTQNFAREIPPCMHISDRKSSQTWNKNVDAWFYFHIKSDLVSRIIFHIKSNADTCFLLSH